MTAPDGNRFRFESRARQGTFSPARDWLRARQEAADNPSKARKAIALRGSAGRSRAAEEEIMRKSGRILLAAGLLCGTGLATALAQEANQAEGDRQGCESLTQLIRENEERLRDEWIDQANTAVRQNREQRCAQYVAQAEDALRKLDQEEAQDQRSGRDRQRQGQADDRGIMIEQAQPRITVQQGSPEITYAQPQPRVNVQQGRPEIVVRQAKPTIHVEMPRPRITIQQPEPEIIVRMPEPDVSVSMPEPDVEVSRSEPQVQVQQPEEEPVIRRRTGGEQQARVNVQRQEPRVRFERAEPNVEFEMTGEPQVRFERTGKPQVRFEQTQQQQAAAGEEVTRQPQARRQQAQAEQQVGRDQTASIERRPVSEQARRMLQGDDREEAEGRTWRILVSDLVGRDVVNRRGEELGTVDRVIRSNDRLYVVLQHGGFLGLGEDEVAVPLDRISSVRGDDQLLMRGMSEEDIEAMPNISSETGTELRNNMRVEISES
ncbi:hypothetical protein LCM4579_06700 [Ensifer sp. LCM 4579]|nr:hypothetical protein LCM4579_06700 [Ensifer sp. LCM 4579]